MNAILELNNNINKINRSVSLNLSSFGRIFNEEISLFEDIFSGMFSNIEKTILPTYDIKAINDNEYQIRIEGIKAANNDINVIRERNNLIISTLPIDDINNVEIKKKGDKEVPQTKNEKWHIPDSQRQIKEPGKSEGNIDKNKKASDMSINSNHPLSLSSGIMTQDFIVRFKIPESVIVKEPIFSNDIMTINIVHDIDSEMKKTGIN